MAKVLPAVRAQRGATLRCRGWRQEGILRMLENTMENAEKPEELIIYGGQGRCARNWDSYHAIVNSLKNLENDETLAIQSGMPVAIFKTHELAPRVLMANTNILKATWPIFYDLQAKGLTMFAQYTAGAWEYIGTQGVIQGTFETLGAIGRLRFRGSLVGRILLTAGLGGMGGNQPRAMTMHGGVCVAVEADEAMIRKRIQVGYCDVMTDSLEEAVEMAQKAKREERPLGIGLLGNAAEVMPRAVRKFKPDIVTDMTPAHDPLYYIPRGFSPEEAARLREKNPALYLRKARESIVQHFRAMLAFQRKGVEVFEYGNCIRKEAFQGGVKNVYKIPNFVAAYIRPLFCEGRGPFRWVCLSGEPRDLQVLDDLILSEFNADHLVVKWINLARKDIPVEGLPARVCYLGYGERARFGLKVNAMVRSGELKGPVGISRDNLDSGSVTNPTFESEAMKDGSDLISDWPYLNALLNTAAMADLVAIQGNYSMGEAAHTAVTMIADGDKTSDVRLDRVLTTDPGIGVVRHAQAGYETARKMVKAEGIRVPLWWGPPRAR